MSAETRRRWWSEAMVNRAAGLDIPRYGSAEWLELPEGSPAKVAAVIIAAECWVRSDEHLVDELRIEVDELRRAHKANEDAEYQQRAAAHRDYWRQKRQQAERRERGGVVLPFDGKVRDLYDIGADHVKNGGRPA